jgi:uncharacterized protein YndB with AHSA1/START domain
MPATSQVSTSNPRTETALPQLSIRRNFNAPRELVFEVFTNPDHLKNWMGPRAFTATLVEQDASPGGRWRGRIRQTAEWNGQIYPELGMGGVFKEINPPERIVYTFAWEGQGGQPTRETVITVTFTKLGEAKTQMDFHQAFFDSTEQRDGHNQGWNSSFDKLDDYLATLAD